LARFPPASRRTVTAGAALPLRRVEPCRFLRFVVVRHGDPSRHATLLAAYQEALNHLLEISEHMVQSDNHHPVDMEANCSVME
jgi:hypothetical protein